MYVDYALLIWISVRGCHSLRKGSGCAGTPHSLVSMLQAGLKGQELVLVAQVVDPISNESTVSFQSICCVHLLGIILRVAGELWSRLPEGGVVHQPVGLGGCRSRWG